MIRRATLTWLLMIPVAILNGGFREAVLVPAVGDLRGHQLSVLTGSVAFFALVYTMLHRDVPRYTDRWLLGLGGVWVVATIVFEFIFGHWVMGHTWSYLLADYNVFAGRLWPVVLAAVAIAPLAVKRIVTHRRDPRRGAVSGSPDTPDPTSHVKAPDRPFGLPHQPRWKQFVAAR